jgi:uncharacterized LabA/DUF88 family protein
MVEKGVDIMLATDFLYYAWQDFYDVGILVSGDGDFAYALQNAKNMGKYVQVVAFESNQSPELWQLADERTLLNTDVITSQNLWMNKDDGKVRRRRRRSPGTRRSSSESAASNGAPAQTDDQAAPNDTNMAAD